MPDAIDGQSHNVFEEVDANPAATIRKFRIVQTEGRPCVTGFVDHCKLDPGATIRRFRIVQTGGTCKVTRLRARTGADCHHQERTTS